MTKFAICDNGIVDARNVPQALFGSPGACPAGIYHTFYRHDTYVGALELRISYFAEQLRASGFDPEKYVSSLFNANLLKDLLTREGLEDTPARLRMMVFDDPVTLENGVTTAAIAFARAEETKPDYTAPFRCAIAPRRRLEITDDWSIKRLGRRQMDQDLTDAKARGYDDVLYLDRMGQWCEASYANIVAVFGNRICIIAPPGLSYRGLTSGSFSIIKSELKPLQVHNAAVGMLEIAKADEVFLTSAVRGLQPVSEIEGIGTWPLDHPDSVRNRIYNKLVNSAII